LRSHYPALIMNATAHLAAACFALVVLTVCVGLRLLFVRIAEMREKRVRPQDAATSQQLAARLSKVQASDNFKNLFETPVLFYAFATLAIATQQTAAGFIYGAWGYVLLRAAHSLIQCTYNKVEHRFAVFAAGYSLLFVMWAFLVVAIAGKFNF
jgi:hypothetical protein